MLYAVYLEKQCCNPYENSGSKHRETQALTTDGGEFHGGTILVENFWSIVQCLSDDDGFKVDEADEAA